MMHKNPIWLVFIAVIGAIVLWYSATAIYKVYRYSLLTQTTSVNVQEWVVKEISSEEFAPYGRYIFHVKGKEYLGESQLYSPVYRNAWAVEEEFPKLTENTRTVWYNPKNPNDSALQKKFPLKECISAAVLLALFLYFLGLGYYVVRRSGNTQNHH